MFAEISTFQERYPQFEPYFVDPSLVKVLIADPSLGFTLRVACGNATARSCAFVPIAIVDCHLHIASGKA